MAEASDHVIVGNLPEDLDEATLKTNFEAYGTIKWCKLFTGKGGGKKSAMIEFSSVEEATWLVENLDGNVPLGLETEVTVKFKPAKGAGGEGGGGKGGKAAAAGGWKGGGEGAGNRSQPYGGGGKGDFSAGMGKGGAKGGMMMMGMGGPCSITDLWKGLLRHKVLPGGTWENDERTILVSGLPSDTTDQDLLKIFSPFGAIAPGGVRVRLNDDGTAKGNGMINFLNLESATTSIATLNNCMMPDGRFLRLRQFGEWDQAKGKGGKGGKGKGKQAPEAETEG